jgi:Protein of unknown function (DUF3619)
MTNSLQHRSEILQDRFGFKLAGRLAGASAEIPHDISERLRVARVQAVARRKVTRLQVATAVNGNGGAATLNFGDEGLGLWSRIASFLPLIALVAGLIAINMLQNDNRARELAEVDAALLTDDLPPNAYSDPGFIQFLKAGPDNAR